MAMARGGILAALLRQRRHRLIQQTTPPCPSSLLLLCRRSYSNKLFVGGLSFRTDEEAVRKAFSQHGDVVEVKLITDRETGRPKGFGFVTFNSDDAAETARSKMTGQLLDGRMIRVDKASSNRPSVPSSSFNGTSSSFSPSSSSSFSGPGSFSSSSSSVSEDWGTLPNNSVQFGETAPQSSGFPSNQGLNTTFGSSIGSALESSNSSTFESSNTSTFGSFSSSTFGSSNASTFGNSNSTAFGSSNTTTFGSTNSTAFGSSTATSSGFTSATSSFGVQKKASDDWGSLPSNAVDFSGNGQINSSAVSGVNNVDLSKNSSPFPSNQASTGQVSSDGTGGASSGIDSNVYVSEVQTSSFSNNIGASGSSSQQTNTYSFNSGTSQSILQTPSVTTPFSAPIGSSEATTSNSVSGGIASVSVDSNAPNVTTPSTTPHPLNSPAITSSGSFNFSNFSFDSTSYRDNDPPLPRRRPRPRPRTMNQSSSGLGMNLNSGTGSVLETMSPFGSNNQYAETSIPKFKGPEYDFGLLNLGAVSKSDRRPQGVFDIDIPEDLPEPPPPEPPKPKPLGLPLFPQKTLPSLDLPWGTPEADNWSEIGEDPPKYDLSSLFPSMGELIKKEKEFHWDPYDFDEEAKATLPPEEEVIEIDSDYD